MPNLDFFIEGKGPVVLFLHGWGQNKEMMYPLIKVLRNKYTCVAIDMPGFGNSEFNHSKDISEYARSIHDFLINKNIKVSYIIGHSFGGKVALEYHLLFGVKSIAFIASPLLKPKRSLKCYFSILLYKIKKRLKFNTNMGSEDYKNTSSEMKGFFIKVVNTHYNKIIKRLRIPVLLVYSKEDEKVSFANAKKINKKLLRSKLRVINGDHFAYLSNREIIGIEINDFFTEREKRVYYL